MILKIRAHVNKIISGLVALVAAITSSVVFIQNYKILSTSEYKKINTRIDANQKYIQEKRVNFIKKHGGKLEIDPADVKYSDMRIANDYYGDLPKEKREHDEELRLISKRIANWLAEHPNGFQQP